jgi:hypothetical protein
MDEVAGVLCLAILQQPELIVNEYTPPDENALSIICCS